MGNRQTGSKLHADALEYMEKKYGDKFEYYAPYGDSMTGTHKFVARCADFPEQNVLVEICDYRSKEKTYLDNYLAVKYREDTERFVLDCARQVFGEATVFYNVDLQSLSPELPATALFQEYLADTTVSLKLMVEIKASDLQSEEQVQELAELLSIYGTEFYLSVVAVTDDMYGIYDHGSLGKLVALEQYVRCAQVTQLDGQLVIRWSKKE